VGVYELRSLSNLNPSFDSSSAKLDVCSRNFDVDLSSALAGYVDSGFQKRTLRI
jgi:hypothetical protein